MRFSVKFVLFVAMPVVALAAWWLGNDDLGLPAITRLGFLFIACCLVSSFLISRSVAQQIRSETQHDDRSAE